MRIGRFLLWTLYNSADAFGSRRPVSGGPSSSEKSSSSGNIQSTNSMSEFENSKGLKPRHWYSLELDMPCQFVKLVEDPQYSSKTIPVYDLVYLTKSQPQVRRIQDIALKLANPEEMQQSTRIVAESISVPNDVGVMPQGSIGGMTPNVWWIATGQTMSSLSTNSFSNREAQTGAVYFLDMTKQSYNPTAIVTSPGYGYTHVEWVDMDLDGNADAIAIRTNPTGQQELVWMQQPPGNSKWMVSVIDKNVGGTQFKTMWIKDGDVKRLLIICAGSAEPQLVFYWVDDPDNDWTRISRIQKTVIGEEGSYVNIEIIDVNADGRLDILTSVTGIRGQPGKVICYEVPEQSSFQKGIWRKHILSQAFEPSVNYRALTPGGVYAFYPGKSPTEKPSILVSGASNGKVYILRPKSWSAYIWHYTTDVILERKNTIGVPAVRDVDGDGNVDIFIPEANYIHVLTFKGVEQQRNMPDSSITPHASTLLAVFLGVCLIL